MMDWKGKAVVVTAVTGDYEHYGTHALTDGVDYVFYTDGIAPDPNPMWRRIMLPSPPNLDKRRQAKLPKLCPHALKDLLPYRYMIWIDGSMQITRPEFVEEALSYLNHGLVLSPHFDGRDCAYGEATIRPPKYANEPLDEQVANYRREGFPEHYGLYECGLLIRDMQAPGVEMLGFHWYTENMTWSYQDQISLPYCLWKHKFKPDVLPETFRNMNWVHINAHRSEL